MEVASIALLVSQEGRAPTTWATSPRIAAATGRRVVEFDEIAPGQVHVSAGPVVSCGSMTHSCPTDLSSNVQVHDSKSFKRANFGEASSTSGPG